MESFVLAGKARDVFGLLELKAKRELLKCTKCGHVSYDRDEVDYFVVHIGGKGDVRQPECVNLHQCWHRLGWE